MRMKFSYVKYARALTTKMKKRFYVYLVFFNICLFFTHNIRNPVLLVLQSMLKNRYGQDICTFSVSTDKTHIQGQGPNTKGGGGTHSPVCLSRS